MRESSVRRRELRLILACAVLGGATSGLLGLTTQAEDEVPATDKNVSAEVVDTAQATTRGDHVSVDGVTYFSVLHGKMTIFVPFEKLQSVEAIGAPATIDGVDRVEATFTFHDGSSEKGYLKARQTLYGASKLGAFQLKLRDLRSIRFLGVTAAPPKPARTSPP